MGDPGQGFAIKHARLASQPDSTWLPSEIDAHVDERRSQDWVCGGCASPVQAVRGHLLRTGTWRDAHFALRRPKSSDRAQHETDCIFNIVRVVRDEVRDCRAVRPARNANRFELVITEDQWRAEKATPHERDDGRSPAMPPSEELRHRVIGPRRRPTLLNDVLVVIELLHRYYDDPEAQELFSAVWQPQTRGRRRATKPVEIPWHDFYVPPTRHSVLVRRVLDGTPPMHPVAVAGQIVRVKREPDKDFEAIYLALKHQPPGATERLVARAHRNVGLFADLAEGDAVIVLDTWARFPKPTDTRLRHTSYCTAWPSSLNQIRRLEDPGIIDHPT